MLGLQCGPKSLRNSSNTNQKLWRLQEVWPGTERSTWCFPWRSWRLRTGGLNLLISPMKTFSCSSKPNSRRHEARRLFLSLPFVSLWMMDELLAETAIEEDEGVGSPNDRLFIIKGIKPDDQAEEDSPNQCVMQPPQAFLSHPCRCVSFKPICLFFLFLIPCPDLLEKLSIDAFCSHRKAALHRSLIEWLALVFKLWFSTWGWVNKEWCCQTRNPSSPVTMQHFDHKLFLLWKNIVWPRNLGFDGATVKTLLFLIHGSTYSFLLSRNSKKS